jgi:antitoxin ParD1/3/4
VKLEAMLLESLKSGDAIDVTPEYWENKRQGLLQRFGKSTS